MSQRDKTFYTALQLLNSNDADSELKLKQMLDNYVAQVKQGT